MDHTSLHRARVKLFEADLYYSTFLALFIKKGVKKLREFDGHGRSTPLRTTSIGFHSSTPWNATGFYYSPRYPESYRGRVKNSR